MVIIKTKHYHTPLDVIIDGRYIFIDAVHDVVAVANYNDDDSVPKPDTWCFDVERTLAIDTSTIERVIKNYVDDARSRCGLPSVKCEFNYKTLEQVSSLPYDLEINLKKK